MKRFLGIFVVAFLMATLYAVFIGLVSGPPWTPFIAWPILTCFFWLIFWNFRVLHLSGYIAVVPVSVIAFEILWPVARPGAIADRYVAFDRSHYTAGVRVPNPWPNEAEPEAPGWGLKEILIGKDGFRADPETGEGNPERCEFVLIGDSMIYGSGLPYSRTLGPILRSRGLRACVFGVTGNGTVDYLATLRFAANRIDPGAHVAIYLYAYNDFVSLEKYLRRGFLRISQWVPKLFEWGVAFDRWRRATFIRNAFRAERAQPRMTLWQYDVGRTEPIRLLYPQDPAENRPPRPLNGRQRAALDFFFKGVDSLARARSWHIYMIVHPDYTEFFANLARRSPDFADLDPRRADGLKACKEFAFVCEDISRFLYEKSIAEAKSPYFINNRHFSAFGTRIVADHFVTLTRKAAHRRAAMTP